MADRFNTLAQEILNKPFMDCSEEELLRLAEQYPYMAIAQFLYLKKLSPDTEAYKIQFQKAVLYYHNPAGFHHFINDFNMEFDEEWKTWIQEESATSHNLIDTELLLPIVDEEIISLNTNDQPEIEQSSNKTIKTNHADKEIDPIQIAEASNTEMAFEPFHTVDYFASQGIKLSLEEIPKDKLGKQLKSFTEWLKTMKKLPVQEASRSVAGTEERRVENLAAISVKTTDIITESMAEVWLSQGNRQKAIEVYRKLSLLNPAKSAYFAAKIENLNDSN